MKMKLAIATLLICLLWETQQAFSVDDSAGEFSSLLESVVLGDAPITQPFRINGPNGFCAHTTDFTLLQLRDCGTIDLAERFTLYDDGTLRVNSKCLTARGFGQGSLVEPDSCNNPDKNAITWRLKLSDRQIFHPATGLVLSAISGVCSSTITLEANAFSSYQTWRLDYDPPVPSAHIIGMNNLCLLSSPYNEVWVGTCGTATVASQKWHIYPDGTIRPQLRSTNGCLSFDDLTSSKVLVTSCGLAPSAERWVLTENKSILNEKTNRVLDVYNADPSAKIIGLIPFHGGDNQQWRILYD